MQSSAPHDRGTATRRSSVNFSAVVTLFANELQRTVMSRPVIDNTGLSGRFDFGLEWTPDELQFGGRSVDANANSGKPDLAKALE